MTEPRRDLGENDASFTAALGNVGELVADIVSHVLHPMVEAYAQLFAHGAVRRYYGAPVT